MYQIFWQPTSIRNNCVVNTNNYRDIFFNGNGGNNSNNGSHNYKRKQAWESGHIDYKGIDSFSNIQRKLDAAINHLSELKMDEKPQDGIKLDENYLHYEQHQNQYYYHHHFHTPHDHFNFNNQNQNNKELYNINENNNTKLIDKQLDESEQRRRAWEAGNIDYKGIDKFENIQRKIDAEANRIRNRIKSRNKPSSFSDLATAKTKQIYRGQKVEKNTELSLPSQYNVSFGSDSGNNELRYNDNDDNQYQRKKAWEDGNIDYRGVDCFANIQRKIDQALGQKKPSAVVKEKSRAKLKSRSGKTSQHSKPKLEKSSQSADKGASQNAIHSSAITSSPAKTSKKSIKTAADIVSSGQSYQFTQSSQSLSLRPKPVSSTSQDFHAIHNNYTLPVESPLPLSATSSLRPSSANAGQNDAVKKKAELDCTKSGQLEKLFGQTTSKQNDNGQSDKEKKNKKEKKLDDEKDGQVKKSLQQSKSKEKTKHRIKKHQVKSQISPFEHFRFPQSSSKVYNNSISKDDHDGFLHDNYVGDDDYLPFDDDDDFDLDFVHPPTGIINARNIDGYGFGYSYEDDDDDAPIYPPPPLPPPAPINISKQPTKSILRAVRQQLNSPRNSRDSSPRSSFSVSQPAKTDSTISNQRSSESPNASSSALINRKGKESGKYGTVTNSSSRPVTLVNRSQQADQ